MANKSISPKKHLKDVFRTPMDSRDRLKFLRLDKNEDPEGLPPEFIHKVLSEISPSFISSYPQPYQLYDKIAQWLEIGIDQLLVTSGSDAAIKTVFEVFVEPGAEIVFPEPTYAMFNVYGQLFRAKVKHINYEVDLAFSVKKMKDAITHKTKLVAFANPDSPTGTIIGRDNIVDIIEIAKKKGAVVLVDEAYYPFHNETVIDLTSKYKNLIVTRTFSKAFRLASVRLGIAVAHPDTTEVLRKFRPMYDVNSFAVLFGSAILDNLDMMQQFVDAVEEGKIFIVKEAQKRGLKTLQTHANFILIVVGEEKVRDLVGYMAQSGILISGGFSHPALKKCIRISLGPIKQMKTFVDKLDEYFEGVRT
jgi:histidinol-phosphate aminotransferase